MTALRTLVTGGADSRFSGGRTAGGRSARALAYLIVVIVVLGAVVVSCGADSPESAPTAAPAQATQTPPTTAPVSPTAAAAAPAPRGLPQLDVEPAFPNISLQRMVHLTYSSEDDDRLFVVLQPGRIVFFEDRPDAEDVRTFLDIREQVSDRGNEEGLLGLAFDPEYESNGYFYVYYSAANPRRSIISRFSVDPGDPNLGDPSSETEIMTVSQPYSNHNGGHIVFGPDGYLYVGLGDGGSANDPDGNGQDRTTLLGTILRIDVSTLDSLGRYSVPPDNPFVGEGGGVRPEIWAYGLRNPWRFNFDPATGELWAADVGQNAWEEVDLIRPGLNYGWDIMEGAHCTPSRGLTGLLRRGPEECDRAGLELPIIEYGRDGGCSITGGYVYRGSRLPSLSGAYVYGDFCSGRIWALRASSGALVEHKLLVDTAISLSAFGENPEGELFMLSFDRTIYRFVQP